MLTTNEMPLRMGSEQIEISQRRVFATRRPPEIGSTNRSLPEACRWSLALRLRPPVFVVPLVTTLEH